ncbi:MAG: hypothetical protein HYY45_04670 [Deltaproteobacteria bacterium]|nr:hypothetical protein [Deltaproteobacteria bacterium]
MRNHRIFSGVIAFSIGITLLMPPSVVNAIGWPIYGNWGGPGWSGGSNGNKAPCDVMDAAFMRHDIKYEQVKGLWSRLSLLQRARAVALADQELVNEVSAINPETLRVTSKCKDLPKSKGVRNDTINYFRPKAKQNQEVARMIQTGECKDAVVSLYGNSACIRKTIVLGKRR